MMTTLRNPRFLTSIACALTFSSALIAEVSNEEPLEKSKQEQFALLLSNEAPNEEPQDTSKEEQYALFFSNEAPNEEPQDNTKQEQYAFRFSNEIPNEEPQDKSKQEQYVRLISNEIPNEDPQDKQEHIAVGSRPMDPEKIAQIEAQQLQRAYEIEDPTAPPNAELQSYVSRANYQDDGKPAFRLATAEVTPPTLSLASFPVSCHWVTWKSTDLRHIKIEDGSTWEIASGDLATVNTWRNDDPLFITPVTSWFISQHYYITNRTNNSYVKANLVDGPVAFGPYSHWVTGVDTVQGHVFLENQSVWCVDPKDMYILADRRNNSEWAPNDHIIVILHDSRYSAYDHILINVNLNCKVHARPY